MVSNLTAEVTGDLSNQRPSSYLSVSPMKVHFLARNKGIKSSNTIPFKTFGSNFKEKGNRHILGFQDRQKVDEVPNATLLLVIIATITNHLVSGNLIDNGSYYDIIYIDIFNRLGLRDQDLKPYEDVNLLVFNKSPMHSCGAIELTIYIE